MFVRSSTIYFYFYCSLIKVLNQTHKITGIRLRRRLLQPQSALNDYIHNKTLLTYIRSIIAVNDRELVIGVATVLQADPRLPTAVRSFVRDVPSLLFFFSYLLLLFFFFCA